LQRLKPALMKIKFNRAFQIFGIFLIAQMNADRFEVIALAASFFTIC
jgi:hypothetical protein